MAPGWSTSAWAKVFSIDFLDWICKTYDLLATQARRGTLSP